MASIPQMKIAQIYKYYQRNPNNAWIAEKMGLNHATVGKYVISENMADRRERTIRMASDLMVTKQADQLVQDMIEVQTIKDITVDSLIERIETGEYAPTVSDLDKLQRLGLHLRGMPDLTVETKNTTIEVVQVARSDVIDAEFEDDEKTK